MRSRNLLLRFAANTKMSTGFIVSFAYENITTYPPNLTTNSIADTTEDLPYTIPWVMVALYMIVSSFIMGGNSLVTAAVAKFQILQTPTNLFVAGLASFDFALGFSGWSMVVGLIQPPLLRGFVQCFARTIFGAVNGLSSAMMLAGS